MGMLCHLTGLSWMVSLPGIVGPLIIWLIKKDEMPFVDDQGKESINFQITMLIGSVVLTIIAVATCGFGLVLAPVLVVFVIVFPIVGAIKANAGQYYRYPMTIRLVT